MKMKFINTSNMNTVVTELRKQADLSGRKLSSMAGVSNATISRMGNNKIVTNMALFIKLVNAMGYDVALVKKGE